MIPLFLTPLGQVFTLERMTTGIVREKVHMAGGTQEDLSTFKLWLCPGSNPCLLGGRQVLYPLRYAPRASLKHETSSRPVL